MSTARTPTKSKQKYALSSSTPSSAYAKPKSPLARNARTASEVFEDDFLDSKTLRTRSQNGSLSNRRHATKIIHSQKGTFSIGFTFQDFGLVDKLRKYRMKEKEFSQSIHSAVHPFRYISDSKSEQTLPQVKEDPEVNFSNFAPWFNEMTAKLESQMHRRKSNRDVLSNSHSSVLTPFEPIPSPPSQNSSNEPTASPTNDQITPEGPTTTDVAETTSKQEYEESADKKSGAVDVYVKDEQGNNKQKDQKDTDVWKESNMLFMKRETKSMESKDFERISNKSKKKTKRSLKHNSVGIMVTVAT